ncbi:hypothetical protein DFH08DRAFT_47371 [Mycena albidolilacea]|uniref:Uncharacterized protein n=1 Tax=Mycena albidolilacea TaxID=1033008 RepID=A0AAD7AC56_9AGAR|nr:hypothetical protein DFH08DRAFT_47371 [Mycena albidolilacea]
MTLMMARKLKLCWAHAVHGAWGREVCDALTLRKIVVEFFVSECRGSRFVCICRWSWRLRSSLLPKRLIFCRAISKKFMDLPVEYPAKSFDSRCSVPCLDRDLQSQPAGPYRR